MKCVVFWIVLHINYSLYVVSLVVLTNKKLFVLESSYAQNNGFGETISDYLTKVSAGTILCSVVKVT